MAVTRVKKVWVEDWKAALCAERASAEDLGEGKGALVSAWTAWPAAWSICGTCSFIVLSSWMRSAGVF